MLTKARARALLTELIVGFSTRPFQQKLDDLVHAHVAARTGISVGAVANCAAPTEVFQLEGRKELALTVQREVLPRYGFEPTEEGVQQMVRAMQPHLSEARIWEQSEAIKKKLRMPSKMTLDSDSEDEFALANLAGNEAVPRRLRRDKAVALQTELLQEYSQPEFQARLREAMQIKDKEAQRQERKRLLREVQAMVMPRYGFEATDAGIASMKASFTPWNNDEEVQSLDLAMEEQLTNCISDVMAQNLAERKAPATAKKPVASVSASPLPRANSSLSTATRPSASPQSDKKEPSGTPVATPSAVKKDSPGQGSQGQENGSVASPFGKLPPLAESEKNPPQDSITKEATAALLNELLSAFSTVEFQNQIALLKRSAASHHGGDLVSLRNSVDEVALTVQCRILPRYGFEASRHGVLSMICECSRHIKDEEVRKLNDAINDKLGRDMQESHRFRQRLDSLSEFGSSRAVAGY